MKTSVRLLLVTAALAVTASVQAGPGPAYWMHAKPAAEQARVTAPATTKAAVENTAPRAYERGVKPAMPANTAACCGQS